MQPRLCLFRQSIVPCEPPNIREDVIRLDLGRANAQFVVIKLQATIGQIHGVCENFLSFCKSLAGLEQHRNSLAAAGSGGQ